MNDILPFQTPIRDAAHREAASDELGVARCPICQVPLRVEMNCEGPHFVCACGKKAA